MQEVFRFTAVRSARPLATDRWLQVDVSRPDATLDGSDDRSDDEGSGEEGGQGGAGAGEAPDVPELLDRLGQWLAEVGDRRGPRDVEAWVATSTRPARGGRAVRALVASAAYRAARAELATRLVDGADAEPAGGTDEPAVRLLLVCGLLERLATEPGSRRLTDASGIADWLARSLVVLDQAPDPPDDSGRPRDDERGAADVARFAAPGRIPRPAVAPTDLAPEGWRPWMALARPPRVGELVVVERELCGYAMGEVADIENVLAGEQLEHQDRDLELTEEETVTEEERTVVRSDSRESREESRLRTEAEQVVQNDTRFEASLNLVAQYPPYVTLTADAGLQINTTRAQTDRSIAETAREVTEKAARQVTDRVLTRRTTRTRRERERRYRHRFEAGDTDVVGVYRFVDAVWTARSVRYDPPRLQCELVIPEPAAWLRRVLAGRPPVTIAMTEPTLPVNARGEPLGVTDIARDNWSVLAARVRATSVPPPPEPVIRVSRTIKLADNPPFTATNPANVGVVLRPRVEARDTLAVPDGYRAESYILAISGLPTFGVQAAARFNVVIGDQSPQTLVAADPTNQNVVRAEGFFGAITDLVAVSIEHELSYGFSGVVTVSCVPTEESMNRWRSTVHTRIWAAYQAAAELYESRLDEARARSGEPPAGLRSSDARRLIEIELRRLSLTMLAGGDFPRPDGVMLLQGDYLTPDLTVNRTERARILFLEQAFDWRAIQYVPYPYYWGQRDRWQTLATEDGPDAMLAEFERAGAVRVVVPARPEFSLAVLYYLRRGKVWFGGRPPQSGDPLYVSIAMELGDQLDRPRDGVVLETWRFRLPTPHLILGSLPECRDTSAPTNDPDE